MSLNCFDKNDYAQWRELKLRHSVRRAEDLMVEIDNPARLSRQEQQAIVHYCAQTNMCFYRSARALADSNELKALGAQLGLHQLCNNPGADANKISLIEVVHDSLYIPYSNKALSWHTDGYYNTTADTVRSFMMHCVRPAADGGDNSYLDPELIFLLLYDQNPDYITALSHPQAMTIPANQDQRGMRSGPVFRLDAVTGKLVMRYTERLRHIKWHPSCHKALESLRTLLRTTPYKLNYKLSAKEGVICNNVLHTRSAFSDSPQRRRLLYRARYRELVSAQ